MSSGFVRLVGILCLGARVIVFAICGQGRERIAGEQLVAAEQARLFEFVHVGQLAQAGKTEVAQEGRGGDIGVGRPRLQAARARGDIVLLAQGGDGVAADGAAGNLVPRLPRPFSAPQSSYTR